MDDEPPVDLDVAACLAEAFGVMPPAVVVECARKAFDHATREGFVNDTDYLSFGGLRFDLVGLAQRPVWPECAAYGYPSTPPELFVFGAPGVDGIHYGFIVHDPAVQPHALGAFNPMHAEAGVRALSLEVLRGEGGDVVFDPHWPAVEPAVPEGWRHMPSRDGIGVLAPASAFGETPEVELGHYAALAPVERAATLALMKGFPATSLWLLREFFAHNHGGDAVAARAALRLMAQAYRALQRPLLADVALRHAEQHWSKG